jgi:hypothetical protein
VRRDLAERLEEARLAAGEHGAGRAELLGPRRVGLARLLERARGRDGQRRGERDEGEHFWMGGGERGREGGSGERGRRRLVEEEVRKVTLQSLQPATPPRCPCTGNAPSKEEEEEQERKRLI